MFQVAPRKERRVTMDELKNQVLPNQSFLRLPLLKLLGKNLPKLKKGLSKM